MCLIRFKPTTIFWLERIEFCVASDVSQSKKIKAKHHGGHWAFMAHNALHVLNHIQQDCYPFGLGQSAPVRYWLFLARAEYTDTQ